MGIKNYLIDGVSGTGKTTVAEELEKLGYHVLHGDRTLKYRGAPKTGQPISAPSFDNEYDKAQWFHKHLLWDISKVQSAINDKTIPISFFCGGCRNSSKFIDLLDGVFILYVDDINTLFQRMDDRVAIDPTDFGGKPEEKDLVAKVHATQEDMPPHGFKIDSTMPIDKVVNTILEQCNQTKPKPHPLKP